MNNKAIKLYFFGDSICFGQYVSPHLVWVNRIAVNLIEISQKYGNNLIVQNCSISGNTTRQALERMPKEVQTQSPEILVVQFGLNDCNYWESDKGHPRVSLEAFKANLIEIIERARLCGTKRIYILTNHFTGRGHNNLPFQNFCYEESNRLYNNKIRDVAKLNQGTVELIDIENKFIEKIGARDYNAVQKYLLNDLLHLNIEGHNLYYEIVFDRLKEAISSYC